MKKVYQTTVDSGIGDCHRAAIASLLGLEAEQVPNFILFNDETWFEVYLGFMQGCGWVYEGSCSPKAPRGLRKEDSIGGLFYASVPSKTFEGCTHAVLIDLRGIVVHDPNPNMLWLGESVVETGIANYWHMFSKKG